MVAASAQGELVGTTLLQGGPVPVLMPVLGELTPQVLLAPLAAGTKYSFQRCGLGFLGHLLMLPFKSELFTLFSLNRYRLADKGIVNF